MAKAKSPVPEGQHTLSPHLTVKGAPQAIEFYKKAFGATEIHRSPDPSGLIMHASLKVGDSMFFLNDEMPMPGGGKSPTSIGGTAVTINLYVPDADKTFKQAISAGARETMDQKAGDQQDGDQAVSRYLGARLGPEVVDRLVDPLLGGVYAGRSDQLSFEATMPALAAATRDGQPVTAAAARLLDSAPAPPGGGPPAPVFMSLPGGLASLVPAVSAASAADVRTGAMVRAIERSARGWRLTAGSAHDPWFAEADAVVLALPAAPAGRLLAGLPGAAAAAAGLAEVTTASMAIVTLAFPDTAFPVTPAGSGYLVPAVDGRAVKAVTFSTVKWPHLRAAAPGLQIIRCSVGRIGEETLLHRDDADLAELARAELAEATGVRGRPAAARGSAPEAPRLADSTCPRLIVTSAKIARASSNA